MPTKKEKERIIKNRINNFCDSEYFDMLTQYLMQKEPVAFALYMVLKNQGIIDKYDFLYALNDIVRTETTEFLKKRLSADNDDEEIFKSP